METPNIRSKRVQAWPSDSNLICATKLSEPQSNPLHEETNSVTRRNAKHPRRKECNSACCNITPTLPNILPSSILCTNLGKRPNKSRLNSYKRRSRERNKFKPSAQERDYRMTPIWETYSIHATERDYCRKIQDWETKHKRSAEMYDMVSIFEELQLEPHAGNEKPVDYSKFFKKATDGIIDDSLPAKMRVIVNYVKTHVSLKEYASLFEDLAICISGIYCAAGPIGMFVAVLGFLKKRMDTDEPLFLELYEAAFGLFFDRTDIDTEAFTASENGNVGTDPDGKSVDTDPVRAKKYTQCDNTHYSRKTSSDAPIFKFRRGPDPSGFLDESIDEQVAELNKNKVKPSEDPEGVTFVPHAGWASISTLHMLKEKASHPLFQRASFMLSLLVTAGFVKSKVFTVKGYELFRMEAIKEQKNIGDIYETLFSTIVFFLEKGYACFSEGSLHPFWRATDETTEFEEDCLYLETYINVVRNGNLYLQTGKNEDWFQYVLDRARQAGKILYRTAPNNTMKGVIGAKRVKIDKIYSSFHNYLMAAGLREAPFAFCLYGKSSVGKTTLNSILMSAILKHNDYIASDEYISTVQTDDKFYSTYTTKINGLILDDMCNTKADKAQVNPTARIIEIINNAVVYANKAAVEEKGQVLIRPKVVAITTNNPDLDAEFWSVEPVSILRRINCRIIVTVKPDYAIQGKLKTHLVDKNYPHKDAVIKDIWSLGVQYLQPKPLPTNEDGAEGYEWTYFTKSDGKTPLDKLSIEELIEFILPLTREHFTGQAKLVREFTQLHEKINICKECCKVLHDNVVLNKCVCKKPPVVNPDLQAHSGSWFPDDLIATSSVAAASVILASAKHAITSLTNAFFPSPLEWKAVQTMNSIALFSYSEQIATSPFYKWTQFIPDRIVRSRGYAALHAYAERGNRVRVIRNTFLCGLLGFAVIAPNVKSALDLSLTWYSSLGIGTFFMIVNYNFAVLRSHRLSIQSLAERRDLTDVYTHVSHIDKRLGSVVKNGALLLAGLAAFKSIAAMYSYFYGINSVPQSSLNPETDKEISERNDKKNPWGYTTTELPSGDELSKTHTADQAVNKVMKSTIYLRYKREDLKPHFCNGVFIASNLLIVPYHIWFPNVDIYAEPYDYLDVELIRAPMPEGVNNGALGTERIYFKCGKRILEQDLFILHLPYGGTWPNLLPYFPEKLYASETAIVGAYRDSSGNVIKFSGTYTPRNFHYLGVSSRPVYINGGRIDYDILTFAGMCMAPVVANTTCRNIMGFHIAGDTGTKTGAIVALTRSMVSDAIDSIRTVPGYFSAHSSGVLTGIQMGKSIGYKNFIDTKAPIQYVDAVYARIYGGCDGMVTTRSDIRDSILCPNLERELGYQNKWGPPQFNPNGNFWKPWYDTMVQMVNPRHNVDPILLQEAKIDYLSALIPKIKFESVNKYMRPLLYVEVLNGIDGVRFIDSMNMSTSIGFPLSGAKSKKLIDLNPADYPEQACPRTFVPELRVEEQIAEYEETYLRGERNHPVFKACLKDESTLKTKLKVRVFQSAPLVLQCLIRKYFLGIIRFICMFPLLSECAVGINCYSTEWDELHHHITHFGDDRILAGDYSKWDLRLPCHLVGIAFDILIIIARLSGNYSENDIRIMQGIATDIVYPIMAFNGTLIELLGSNPSGQNLTAHLNSICNSVLLRMSFYRIEPTLKDFRTYVKAITYGDDVASGVSNECQNFNHVTVRDFLKTMDIEFTMPDKKSIAVPFLHIKDADFLKRRSVWNDDLGYYVAALDVDSVWKSLFCYRNKNPGQEINILRGTVKAAISEFFYHGRETFELNKAILSNAMIGTGIVVPYWDDITYEHIIDKWKDMYCPIRIAQNKATKKVPVVGSLPDDVISFGEVDFSI